MPDALTEPLEVAPAFDAQGHVLGCPGWADLWQAHWGREHLDASTLRNLADMRARRHTSCAICSDPLSPYPLPAGLDELVDHFALDLIELHAWQQGADFIQAVGAELGVITRGATPDDVAACLASTSRILHDPADAPLPLHLLNASIG